MRDSSSKVKLQSENIISYELEKAAGKGKEQIEINIPDWHKDIVRKRIADYNNNPDQAMEFGSAIDGIEKEL